MFRKLRSDRDIFTARAESAPRRRVSGSSPPGSRPIMIDERRRFGAGIARAAPVGNETESWRKS